MSQLTQQLTPLRAVIYARFSSDKQTDASIEDQIRTCVQHADRENWQVTMKYSDYAISGTSMHRDGIQTLMADAAKRQFDVVICEDLSRLSRDQEHVAGIFKRLTFSDIKIFSLSDGFISDIHIGLKGTMNQLFIKDLGIKTHRGQTGRALKGKFASGRPAYGYDLVKRFDAAGEPVKGERTINQEQAAIVRRIFSEYSKGKSPRNICRDLNKEGILNGAGKTWSSTSLVGVRSNGTGLLNNVLYTGVMEWNKKRFTINPETGKRVARMKPLKDRIIYELPELRIVEQSLWDSVKAKQDLLSIDSAPHTKRRPRKLFSFLMKCGCCGGGFSKSSKNRYACTNSVKKASCENNTSIAQDKLENAILLGLQNELMRSDLLAVFCDAYTKEMATLQKNQHSYIDQAKSKLAKLASEKTSLIEAIKQGVPADEIKEEFTSIAQQREEAQSMLNIKDEKPLILKPDMAEHYRKEVAKLRETLNDDKTRHEATELIRSLIDKIVLLPDERHNKKRLKVDLYGDLAGMLSMASGRRVEKDGVLIQAFEKCQQAPLSHPPNGKQELKDSGADNCLLKCIAKRNLANCYQFRFKFLLYAFTLIE